LFVEDDQNDQNDRERPEDDQEQPENDHGVLELLLLVGL
jgi:hypothetical protein